MTALLSRVQNELFDVGADLCNPVTENPAYPPLRVTPDYIERLERDCDQQQRGPPGAAQLHPARRHPGRRPAAHGPDHRPPGGADHLGRARRRPATR